MTRVVTNPAQGSKAEAARRRGRRRVRVWVGGVVECVRPSGATGKQSHAFTPASGAGGQWQLWVWPLSVRSFSLLSVSLAHERHESRREDDECVGVRVYNLPIRCVFFGG